MTCARTQEFLAKNDVTTAAQVDAKKATMGDDAALALAETVDEIYTIKGKKIVHLDLKKSRPERAELLQYLLGPTGNLRAPTVRKGRTLIVGFEEETFRRLVTGTSA